MPHTIQHFFTSQSNPTQYHHQYYCATVLSQKKRNTWLSTVPYTEGANFTVNLKNSGATQCWQWGSPISKKQKMAAWTQSQCPNTYNHRIVRQEYCKLIHWHSHNNKKEIHDCTYFCIQREPNHCNLKTVSVHNADSGEVLYEESRRRLHEPSHSVLTLTITALWASNAVI